MGDTVIFLSAYRTTTFTKSKNPFTRKEDLLELLKKHHITYTLYKSKIISPEGVLSLDTKYDDVSQISSFTFNPVNEKKSVDDFDELINSTGACIKLLHAHSLLADPRYFQIEQIWGLQSFVVYIDDDVFQIDPIAFALNGSIIIAYEIINLKTGKPLDKDDTSLKMRNWNLRKIKGYKYFEYESISESAYTIPELIYRNLSDFFSELVGKKFVPDDYWYVHDTLVLSNRIKNVEEYFCGLLGLNKLPTALENISTTANYEFYLQDGASVVVRYRRDDIDTALYNAIVFESIKLYIYLFQIINAEETKDLNKVMRNDLYLENLFFAPKVPVETSNLLRCIYQSQSYQHRKEATKLKISYMTTENEVRKNRNTILLNVLLYIATLLGAISTLDALDTRLNIPFEISIIAVVLFFGLFGVIWGIIEYRHNKRF